MLAAFQLPTPPEEDVQGLLESCSSALKAERIGQAKSLADLDDAADQVQSCLLLAEQLLTKDAFENVVATLEPLLEQGLAPADRACALLKLAQAYIRLCEVNHVLRYGLEALSYYRDHHDLAAQSTLHGCLGEAFLRTCAFHEALEHHQAQLELLKEQGSSLVQAYGGVGWIHAQLEDYPKALKFLHEALRLAREGADVTGEGVSLGNLGNTYDSMNDPERALAHYEQATRLFEKRGDLRNVMLGYGNMAHSYFSLGDSERARSYYEKALAQVQKLPNRAYEGWLLLNLGETLLATDPVQAEALMHRGFAVMQGVGSLEGVADAHRVLAAHLERRGEYVQALAHHRSYAELEIKTLKDVSAKRTEALSVKFELERLQQEQEIYRLKNVELVRAVAQLEELSLKDSLTRLHNRRYLDEYLAQAFAEATASQQRLTVLISDIDNFKGVNDRFSHAVGDEVIRAVARIFADNVWGSDVVARYGGEEYVAVFKDTDLTKARRVAEKLRQKVAAYDWSNLHPELSVSISIGLCDDVSLGHHEKMLAAADAKLYEAKRAGKNNVQG